MLLTKMVFRELGIISGGTRYKKFENHCARALLWKGNLSLRVFLPLPNLFVLNLAGIKHIFIFL